MDFAVDGRKAFAYTAAHALDPSKPAIVFVHGAGLDHSWFGLQSRTIHDLRWIQAENRLAR